MATKTQILKKVGTLLSLQQQTIESLQARQEEHQEMFKHILTRLDSLEARITTSRGRIKKSMTGVQACQTDEGLQETPRKEIQENRSTTTKEPGLTFFINSNEGVNSNCSKNVPNENLRLKIVKQDGIMRLKIDEDSSPDLLKKRFEVSYLIVPKLDIKKLWLQQVSREKIDGDAGLSSTIYLSDGFEAILRHDPFEVYVRNKGRNVQIVQLNSHGLFDFEQPRTKRGKDWEERFKGHADTRWYFPQSINFVVSFYEADLVSGIPKHANSLVLKPNRGPGVEQSEHGVEQSEPYRLINLGIFEYVHESPFGLFGSNQIARDAVLQSLKDLVGKPTENAFVNSVKLPNESVLEFFTAICGVFVEELRQTPARVFSLQKLVEISYYNMPRIRMVWARIWSVLANHFIFAGSHHDEKIAMYAIDSLRQLGMKYLGHAELANFTFQNDILKPFVQNSRSESIRSLIVDCIVQIIKSKIGSMKSGWRSVFMIFTAAADDELESIVEKAFENVEQVVLEYFDQVIGDCFMDCVNCLIRFANNKTSHGISLRAIAFLCICEDRLAEGLILGGGLKPIDPTIDETFNVAEHYWFPMLAGSSDLMSDPRPEVRSCAPEVLFDLLNEGGRKFSSSFWESISRRVLFPIFDQVRHAGKESLVELFPDLLIMTCTDVYNDITFLYTNVLLNYPKSELVELAHQVILDSKLLTLYLGTSTVFTTRVVWISRRQS